MKKFIRSRTVATILFLLAMLMVTGVYGYAATRDAGITTVASGLPNPRGLSFGPGDILYVAVAGDATHSGSIIQIRNSMSQHPDYRTIVSGLPRIADEFGDYLGVSGISVLGRGGNTAIYAQIALQPQETGDPRFGELLRVGLDGTTSTVTNVGSFDYQWTADHSYLWEEFPDSNPYGVLAIPGHIYVADAGSNTLDEVMADGSVQVLAYFPNEVIRDAIPTCVTQGPDGALYIGTLAFVDSAILGPSAKVYRVDPSQANLSDPTATPMTRWAQGLWPINGCSFGPDGNFYGSQLYTNPGWFFDPSQDPHGDVVQIPYSSPTTHNFLTSGALSTAGGVAVAPNGAVFVANGTTTSDGSVVRIDLRRGK